MELLSFSLAELSRFAVVLFRVGGIMVFAPFFGSHAIPVQAKIAVTLVVTLVMAPAVPLSYVPSEFGLGQIIISFLSEAALGIALGLAALFVFAGMQLAGQIIGFQLGFSIINLIDPQSDVEVSVISLLENFIGLMLFLLIDGHHWFFMAISESFSYLPATGIRLQGPVVKEMIHLSSQILVSGLQIAAPVLGVTVITDVVLGIIGRAAPQINILIVGMPLKTLVGFSCLSISFFFLPRLLGNSYAQLFHKMFELLRQMA